LGKNKARRSTKNILNFLILYAAQNPANGIRADIKICAGTDTALFDSNTVIKREEKL